VRLRGWATALLPTTNLTKSLIGVRQPTYLEPSALFLSVAMVITCAVRNATHVGAATGRNGSLVVYIASICAAVDDVRRFSSMAPLEDYMIGA
jgi:hypothetical protein